MTFSLAARDPRTGAFGVVLSSSSPAVAARCLHVRPGIGAATTQNVTNPALGPLVLDVLSEGVGAEVALARAVASDSYAAYRQLTAVDATGEVAHFSGAHALGVVATATGRQAVAAGNLLADPGVVRAMIDGYEASTAETFEERLLDGLDAAVSAGGEAGQVRSAGLAVVETASWRVSDLRVDDHDEPAAELRRLTELWLPQKADYLTRALAPASAPSYGVDGDR